MWLITTQGFYSAVAHRDAPELIVVRARAREDIEALRRQIPELETVENAGSDYRWRATVRRAEWEAACVALAADIDYPNFKDAVADRHGSRRHDVYARVWTVLMALQRARDS